MRILQFDGTRVGISMLRVWLGAAALLLVPTASWADSLTVGCPGGTPGQFPSITAALNALPVNSPGEPHTIQVTGNCLENVFIGGRQRITIQAPAGQTATLSAANPAAFAVLHVFSSRSINLQRLVIQGGERGIVADSSDVIVERSSIQNNLGDGLVVQMGSVLRLESSTLQNNGRRGLQIFGGSAVIVEGVSPAEAVHINNNGGQAINVDGSYLQSNGNLRVENNGGSAVNMGGGQARFFANFGENLFQNNAGGLNFFDDASVQFFGRTTIRNNAEAGVNVLGSSVAFNGNVLPDGTFNATVIEGHTVVGMNIVRLGQVSFGGPHKIRNNSAPGADPEFRSGIRVSRASLTISGGTEITNNLGPGIMADLNSSLFVGPNATVSNNAQDGIHVTHQTVNRVVGPVTIQGNGTASIACDGTSLAFGDLGGIEDIACDNVEITGSVAGAGVRSSAEVVTERNEVAPRQIRRAGVVR